MIKGYINYLNKFDEFRTITELDLLTSAKSTKPMASMMSEKIDALRKWAEGRARKTCETEPTSIPKGRKLVL